LNKIILVVVLAIVLTATIAFALPRPAQANKEAFKTMLKNYLSPVIHGYGIGFTGDTYVIAKWHITGIKILNRTEITDIIKQAKAENVTDWSIVKEMIRTQLESGGTTVKKGRIKIDGKMYLLTNITTSDTTASADIGEMPDWEDCKQRNVSAEDCEKNATNIGNILLTKKTRVNQEIANEPRVWAGTLSFNETAYTFVTFVYPR
jgi:hypothetical protein